MLARSAAGAVMGVAMLALIGWVAHIPLLTQIVPGMPTTKFNTALGLGFAGASLLLLAWPRSSHMMRVFSALAAGFVAVLSLVTLAEYATGVSWGIDELFIEDWGDPFAEAPGRMSPLTAVSFAIAAAALLTYRLSGTRAQRAAEVLTTAGGVLALVVVAAYAYEVTALRSALLGRSMALPTSLSFLVLFLGLLMVTPTTWIATAVGQAGTAGVVARRFLPAAILLPLIVGFFRVAAERSGAIAATEGLAVFAVLMSMGLAIAVVQTSRYLGRAESAHRRALEHRARVARLEGFQVYASRLIRTSAHALNTPLTVLKLQIYALKLVLARDGNLSSQHERVLATLERNTERLARVVGQLTTSAKLQAGQLQPHEPSPFDMNELARRVVSMNQDFARSKEVELKLATRGEPIRSYGDEDLLRQAIHELVVNAIDASHPGGWVTVSCMRSPRGGARIRVEDSGRGIEPTILPSLFAPFAMADVDSEGAGKLGLGLHIAQGIVELHSGGIYAESAGEGMGATFTVDLPSEEAARGAQDGADPLTRENGSER